MRATVTAGRHTTSYRVEGAGPPIVLLHGWSQWADQWWDHGYAEHLVDHHRIVALDLLGHGDSDRPHDPDAYTRELIVGEVLAVLDAEGIDQAGLWGYSRGALVAGLVVGAHPERIAWVAYGAQSPAPDNNGDRRAGTLAFARTVTTQDGLARGLAAMGADDSFIAASAERNDPLALSAALIGSAGPFPDVSGVDVPSLFYLGDAEHEFSPTELAAAARQPARTQLAVIPGADHIATFTCSGDVLARVLPFIDGQ